MVSGQFAADEREWTRMGIELRQHMKAVPRITAHLREFSRKIIKSRILRNGWLGARAATRRKCLRAWTLQIVRDVGVIGSLRIWMRAIATHSGQWSVVSGQWSGVRGQGSVVSGQWAVGSGQLRQGGRQCRLH